MLAQKRNLFSWTSPDGPSCGEQAVKMALVGTVFMAVVVGAAAKVTSGWLQEQGVNKPSAPAEPIAVNIGTGARVIPVTLIPANDAAADVVNELHKKRQPRHWWSG